MKFFIDTAKVEDIKAANDMGIICGVTTNPSLIAKEGRDFNEVIKEITEIVQNFDSRINLSNHSLYDIFGLENGESILKEYFFNVQRMDYQDSLEISESKPLIDYIMSCHGNQNEI